MKYNRPQATASWGTMAKDWEKGIDYDRLHKQRLARAQDAIRHAGLGGVIAFNFDNIRYITATPRPARPRHRIVLFCARKADPTRGAAVAPRRLAAEPRSQSFAGERHRPCRRRARPAGGYPGCPTSLAQSVVAWPLARCRPPQQDRVYYARVRSRRGRGHDRSARPGRGAHGRGPRPGPGPGRLMIFLVEDEVLRVLKIRFGIDAGNWRGRQTWPCECRAIHTGCLVNWRARTDSNR
jgi:hypothetical protein